MKKLLILTFCLINSMPAFAGPIHDAAESGDLTAVKSLLDDGADVNSSNYPYNERTPLHSAISNGRTEIVKVLIERGANVNKKLYEDTPLTLAMTVNPNIDLIKRLRMIENLIEHGAEVDKGNYMGFTALIMAARAKQAPILEALIKHGADMNKADKFGRAPLIHSLFSSDCIKLLIDNGADLDARDNKGDTAMHHAAQGSLINMKLLSQAGAKIDKKNSEFRTPLDYLRGDKAQADIKEAVKLFGLLSVLSQEKWKNRFGKSADLISAADKNPFIDSDELSKHLAIILGGPGQWTHAAVFYAIQKSAINQNIRKNLQTAWSMGVAGNTTKVTSTSARN